jgi:ATP-dependent Clp protease ATP-binding subunit ClpA
MNLCKTVSTSSPTEKGKTIPSSDDGKIFFVQNGYDKKFGARPLKRATQKNVDDPLTDKLLSGEIFSGATMTCR